MRCGRSCRGRSRIDTNAHFRESKRMKMPPRNASVVKLALFLGCASIADAQLSTAWVTQFWSGGDEQSQAIAVDSAGQSWITGQTTSNLGGTGNAGGQDFFLSSISPTGTVTSTAQRGSSVQDLSYGIAILGTSAVFIAGGYTGFFRWSEQCGLIRQCRPPLQYCRCLAEHAPDGQHFRGIHERPCRQFNQPI